MKFRTHLSLIWVCLPRSAQSSHSCLIAYKNTQAHLMKWCKRGKRQRTQAQEHSFQAFCKTEKLQITNILEWRSFTTSKTISHQVIIILKPSLSLTLLPKSNILKKYRRYRISSHKLHSLEARCRMIKSSLLSRSKVFPSQNTWGSSLTCRLKSQISSPSTQEIK